MEAPEALRIAWNIADESSEIVKLLVIGHRANGSTFTYDTGLTVDEAKEMSQQFVSWMDAFIGREIERAAQSEG